MSEQVEQNSLEVENAEYSKKIMELLPYLTYTAKFIPFSKVPGIQQPTKKYPFKSLNWICKLILDRTSVEFHYGMGIANVPYYDEQFSRVIYGFEYYNWVAENGKYLDKNSYKQFNSITGSTFSARLLPIPPLVDAICATLRMYETLMFPTLEDYCFNLGYNSDSIKDRDMYTKMIELGLKVRCVFGDETIGKLQDLLNGQY